MDLLSIVGAKHNYFFELKAFVGDDFNLKSFSKWPTKNALGPTQALLGK